MQCSIQFFDADVTRPLALVHAIVDEGIRVVFGSTESYIEHGAKGQNVSMFRKNGVFVLQLDVGPSSTEFLTFGGPTDENEPRGDRFSVGRRKRDPRTL